MVSVVCSRCSYWRQLIGLTRLMSTVESDYTLKNRQWRMAKSEILRRNRHDPVMEKKARNGQLLIPLDQVHEEWKLHSGKYQLKNIGIHYKIYEHVFGRVFFPEAFMSIRYTNGDSSVSVEQGNLLTPQQTAHEPTITLPSTTAEYSSIVLTNPDGYLRGGTEELLHWMVLNVPLGQDVSSGLVASPYLQPVPPRGTGFHRYVFALFTHSQPILPPDRPEDSDWLDQRAFSTRKFIKLNHLKPVGFSFFQAQWDASVSSVYKDQLGFPEPVYGIKKPLTPRRVRQRLVKQSRAAKYSVM